MSIFAGLLDPRIVVVEKPITGSPAARFAEEAQCVAKAVDKRKREFLTGRDCAHEALSALGAPAVPLLPSPDRFPLWPEGFIGSITHTDSQCAAAAGRASGNLRSIGIDLEPAEALPDDLWETVCRPEERARLADSALDQRGLLARAVFSAKECAFKAQFPLTGQMLEFEEIAVEIDLARGLFVASYLRGAPQASATGRIRITDGLLATALSL